MNLTLTASLPEALLSILFAFLGSDPVTPDNASPTAKPPAVESYAAIAEAVADDDRFWTAPFVLADREQRQVLVWGDFSGMNPGEPMEFFVIHEESGHDYESLMVTFARPSDIHRALREIGLEPGGSVDADTHRFWPRGDRVSARFWHGPFEDGAPERTDAETFCIWKGEPMPHMPWVFTGAPEVPSRRHEGKTVYAPDEYSPMSVASTFNLRDTVFDLPLRGTKAGVYGTFIFNPDTDLPEGTPMLMVLTPADPDLIPAEIDLRVRLEPGVVSVTGMEDPPDGDLADLGAFLNRREDERYFLTLDFADELTLAQATARAREVQLLEQHVDTLRIEPPPPGQVFFQSFVPDPRFRDRAGRPSQPVELHLEPTESGWTGTVMDLEEEWGESRTPSILETRVPVATPEAFAAWLEDPENRKPVLFLYAPPETTLRDMRAWTRPVLNRFPIVFVYKTGE